MNCPHCNAEMFTDFDHLNRVRVLVCTRPTCLHRLYPDYPKRNGNEEVCYNCQRIFRVKSEDMGILCPECKAEVLRNKKATEKGSKVRSLSTTERAVSGPNSTKAKMRRAI
jgi:DNA-directed RNA polymerase subunit RPC12/RpoP